MRFLATHHREPASRDRPTQSPGDDRRENEQRCIPEKSSEWNRDKKCLKCVADCLQGSCKSYRCRACRVLYGRRRAAMKASTPHHPHPPPLRIVGARGIARKGGDVYDSLMANKRTDNSDDVMGADAGIFHQFGGGTGAGHRVDCQFNHLRHWAIML